VPSVGSGFNHDVHASLTGEQIGRGPVDYNFGTTKIDSRCRFRELPCLDLLSRVSQTPSLRPGSQSLQLWRLFTR
jgi:hypothetical protein